MNKIIVANWKMNILPSESVKFVREIEKIKTDNQIIILAPLINSTIFSFGTILLLPI